MQRILGMSGSMGFPQIYQQRLIALDPYYAYLAEGTKSVLDVPDLAVLVEDRSDQELETKPINDLIADSWNNNAESEKEYKASDWKDIINNALVAAEPGMKFDLADYDEVSEEEMRKSNSDDASHSLTKKEAFLGRLRPPSRKNVVSNSIPEWIFDQSDELVRQSSMVDSESIMESELTANLSDIEIKENLSDSETPVFTDTIIEESIESVWINEIEHAESDDMDENLKKLADTQEIKVVDYQPAYMLDIAEKAIVGENFKFAFNTYQKLIDQDGQIDEVIRRVEEISAEHPEKPDLLLFLGELYSLKGRRTDALAVYKKAQKNISL